jgi:hypothetical protein
MAHNHRMEEVGEPHLNKVNRMGAGRSDLRRLSSLIAENLYPTNIMMGHNESVFRPDFEPAVNARLSNYRDDRNFANRTGMPQTSLSTDTAEEVNRTFTQRRGRDYDRYLS